ncbi:MAG: hypothetical protein FJ356_05135 [Thaumarchaeota archaeon]|nr:hypothetical protein [Nitrososphaerota archaeon]
MVSFDVNKLREQLKSLKDLPNIKEVIQLRKRLRKELAKVEKPIVTKPEVDKTILANVKRSGKLRRYHNYIRQIRNNFPNLSYNQIRKQFAQRKQDLESDIPDAVWQNPSP